MEGSPFLLIPCSLGSAVVAEEIQSLKSEYPARCIARLPRPR